MADQPEFDFLTKEGLVIALQWVQSQTKPKSISNILISQIINGVLGQNDLENMTPVQLRQLKRKLDTVTSGYITMAHDSIPTVYPANQVAFTLKSQGYQDETLTLQRGKGYINLIALGEAPYEVLTKDPLSDGAGALNTDIGEYFTVSTSDGSNIYFGGNLGGLPAGTSLGTFSVQFSLQMGKLQMGGPVNRVTKSTKATNETSYPFKMSFKSEGNFATPAISGQTVNVVYFQEYNFFNFRWVVDEIVVLTEPIRIEAYKNGISTYSADYPAGTIFSPGNSYGIGGIEQLLPDDVIETRIFYKTDETPENPGGGESD